MCDKVHCCGAGLKQQIDAALGIPELIKPGQITGIAGLPFAAGTPAQAKP